MIQKLAPQRALAGFEEAEPAEPLRRRVVARRRTASPWKQEQFWWVLRHWRPSVPNDRPLDASERAVVHVVARMPATDLECSAAGLGTTTPCPFVRCRHHLSIEVTRAGSLRVLFPHWQDAVPARVPTCSLAEARRGPRSVAVVAEKCGMSQRMVMEVENAAWAKIRKAMDDGRRK